MPTDGPAPNMIPPWAVLMWADSKAVYSEVPFKEGGSYIQRYPLTEAGLWKALHMLIEMHKAIGKDKEYEVKLVKIRPGKLTPSEEQKSRVREMLKRRGLL